MKIEDLFRLSNNSPIALYGLSIETDRFLYEYGDKLSIVGLLDGFRTSGEIYGYPIIPLEDIVRKGVRLIIVIARPGSCKAIARNIGSFCRENQIALFDFKGHDLIAVSKVSYNFNDIKGEPRALLKEKISYCDVISFDLFDTLITRCVLSYTDIFDIMDILLREKGIIIPNFSRLRLYAEKVLSQKKAPRLVEIYQFVLEKTKVNFITEFELADIEWNLDVSTMSERRDVCELFREAISEKKKVVITTDSYYSKKQIFDILVRFKLCGTDKVFISSEYGTSKTQNLFKVLKGNYADEKIIHIGDDEYADIEMATEVGYNTFRLYSGLDLYSHLGTLGLEPAINTLSDRIKVGMLISHLFNSPFWFEGKEQRLSVNNAFDIGYLFCAPIITDFIMWLKTKANEQNYCQIMFCARDGYIPEKLFRTVSPGIKSFYFLSSRIAAIRSGIENDMDIDYVNAMVYSGTMEDSLKTRFGVNSNNNIDKTELHKKILLKSILLKQNYKKYIEKFDFYDDSIGMFDFVAKGTTQFYLQRLFRQHIKGFYFLQLEPGFMTDKDLDIEAFYSIGEKDDSAIFENYYILEAILTSPYPQTEEFDENGDPVFAAETRHEADIKVIEQVQNGILKYFDEYISLVSNYIRIENKSLDEKILRLINRVQILDNDFLSLNIEDPFFGRITKMRDLII